MPTPSSRRRKRFAPIFITVLVLAYILPLLVGVTVAAVSFFRTGQSAVGLLFLLLYGVAGGCVAARVFLAMRQRQRENDSGEDEEASQY